MGMEWIWIGRRGWMTSILRVTNDLDFVISWIEE